MTKSRIMLVEDEAITAHDISTSLMGLGYEVPAIAANGAEAVRMADEVRPDLVMMDIVLDGPMSGIEAAEMIRKTHAIPIVYLTAHTNAETIEKARRSEPFGYLSKPCTLDTIRSTIEMALFKGAADAQRRKAEAELAAALHALKLHKEKLEEEVCRRTAELTRTMITLQQEIKEHERAEAELVKALDEIKALKDQLLLENSYFLQETKKKHQFENIIGQSDGLKYVLYRVEQVATTNTTVLVLGETGTGKELVAAAIHNLSPRKDRPLITVNCAAMPSNLLESELFGREKGAYTGADTQQIGRFEIANGSTLCLDEIGEMPIEMQAKLLRVIQHNEFERLGSSRTIKVDVRIVATTNRNLEEAIRAGRFRQDLFYRLNVFPLTLPPLRQRKEDIPLLVQAFVERYAKKMGKQITSISKDTMKALVDYPWPGNVRELESIVERAIILCPGPGFQLADKLTATPLDISSELGTLKEAEYRQILMALTETGWRIEGRKGAAVILGLHPSTLRARMHKLGIVRPHVANLA